MAPHVGKRLIHFAAIAKMKMNVVNDLMGAWVKTMLVPYIGKAALDSPLFLFNLLRFPAAEQIQKENAITYQRRSEERRVGKDGSSQMTDQPHIARAERFKE